MKKITVINAYGDKNIGDAAILNVALKFINLAYKNNCKIKVMCENTKSFSSFIDAPKNSDSLQLPYGYAIRGNKKVSSFIKLFRFLDIYITSLSLIIANKIINKKLPQSGFYSYISFIKSSDKIIGMGGGYYTTNDPLKDYFGLMLTLLPIYIAKIYKRDILSLPMSFGPFASKRQEQITYNALKKTTLISRDHITLKQIKAIDKNNEIKTYYAPDLALFLNSKKYKIEEKMKSKYIVLTAREWFPDLKKQKKFEDSLVHLINLAWKKHGLNTIFIPMARNHIEDDDNRVARRLLKMIAEKKHFKIINPKSLIDLQYILGKARVGICTRMHSAILSTTVSTPFIAIGYGHKTRGFVKSYNIEKWHIDIGDVTPDVLIKKLHDILNNNNYKNFIKNVEKKHKEIYPYKSDILKDIVESN